MTEQILEDASTIIVAEYRHVASVFRAFRGQEWVSQAELRKRANFTQGTASRVWNAARLLRVLEWGPQGVRITPLGRQWEREVMELNHPAPSTLRQAALHVPLFNETFHGLPGVTDADRVLSYFAKHAQHETPDDLKRALRRYLEGVYGQQLPRSLKRTSRVPQQKVDQRIPAALPTSDLSPEIGRYLEYVERQNRLLQEYGDEFIRRYITSLPERLKPRH